MEKTLLTIQSSYLREAGGHPRNRLRLVRFRVGEAANHVAVHSELDGVESRHADDGR